MLITDYLEPQNLCRRLSFEILVSLTWVWKFLRIRGIAGYVQKRNIEEKLYFSQSSCLLWCKLEWLVVTSMVLLCRAKELFLKEQTQPATLPLLRTTADITAKYLLDFKPSKRKGMAWGGRCFANGCTGFNSSDLTTLSSCIHNIEFEIFQSTVLFSFFCLNTYNFSLAVYPKSNSCTYCA